MSRFSNFFCKTDSLGKEGKGNSARVPRVPKFTHMWVYVWDVLYSVRNEKEEGL